MRFDDEVNKLELCCQRVKAVGLPGIVPDDPYVVITNMALFVVMLRVMKVRRHQGCSMIKDLANVVPPGISVFTILIRMKPSCINIDLPS